MTTITPSRPPEPDELEALIEEARRRARRRRRGYAAALGLAVLIVALVYAFIARGVGGASGSHRDPSVSAVSVPQGFGPGQFWYTRTVSTERVRRPAGGEYHGKVFMRARGPMVAFDVRVSTETWVGVDGTVRQRGVVVSQRFASPAGRARWDAHHRPVPSFARDIDSDSLIGGDGMFPASGPSGVPLGQQDVGDGAFSYRQLLALPPEPRALRARIERAFAALGHRQASSAVNRCESGGTRGCGSGPRVPAWQRRDSRASTDMTEIAQMLSWPVPARLRLALFDAATTLPAVSSDIAVNWHAHDSLGRPGVQVTASPPRYPGHYEPDPMWLIFDRTTGALLAQPGFGSQGVVTAQGVVDSAYGLPKGVSPLHSATAPAQPPIVSISPSVGGPTTVFRVVVSARPGASRRAPRPGTMFAGPVFRGCVSGYNKPTPPSPFPTLSYPATITSRAGRLVYVYRLKPPVGTGNRWCTGRYQLQLDTAGLGPPGPSGAGTASYFRVK
ncbi:MAG: hypothetical protein ACRDNS_06590 [Trebonia sp.]